MAWPRRLRPGQYDQAAAYAKETKTLALEQLKQRPLDAEPHLPLALGAALEVQSQVLAAARAADAGHCAPAGRAADLWNDFHP